MDLVKIIPQICGMRRPRKRGDRPGTHIHQELILDGPDALHRMVRRRASDATETEKAADCAHGICPECKMNPA